MDSDSTPDITEFLTQIGRGSASATAALLPLLYKELRALAGSYFKNQNPGHTLEPTALVHEAFIKMTGSSGEGFKNRGHFFAVAARVMRQILLNHARSKQAAKRSGGQHRITLAGLAETPAEDSQVDFLELDYAMKKLEKLSPRQARIVEMRFLTGLQMDEIASVLKVSNSTVQRDWRMARAFLDCELSGEDL